MTVFTLSFKGQKTSAINCTVLAIKLKEHLEEIHSIGDIIVTKDIDADKLSEWLVPFTPNTGHNLRNMINFGNLPEIKVSAKTSDMLSMEIATMQNSHPHFRPNIIPSFVSVPQTTVKDLPGILVYQGLITGTCKANSNFFH